MCGSGGGGGERREGVRGKNEAYAPVGILAIPCGVEVILVAAVDVLEVVTKRVLEEVGHRQWVKQRRKLCGGLFGRCTSHS